MSGSFGTATYSSGVPVDNRMTLTQFVAELKVRGFDGFTDADLTTYVNRGYQYVARKHRWYWEETTSTFTVGPGDTFVRIDNDLPNFRSLNKLYITTSGSERRLRPVSDDEFFTNWISRDLTAAAGRGEPGHYYVWEGKLYILPPPASERVFVAHYHQRMTLLLNPLDQPITPQHLDEAILMAATVRCHKRSQELTLAASVEADLAEFFDDMSDDEELLMAEQPDRVSPDDSWL